MSGKTQRTPLSNLFLLGCWIVTIPGVFSDTYFQLFSGELPHEYWWQKCTMAFQHGAISNPAAIIIHLLLNSALILTAGRMAERLIGTKRFLVLIITAWTTFICTQWISGIWINGSSGIIWAFSPFLLIITKNSGPQAEKARALLWIMWGVVTILMGIVPIMFNPSHHPLYAFFFGNLFHANATATGFIFYFLWRKQSRRLAIKKRMTSKKPPFYS